MILFYKAVRGIGDHVKIAGCQVLDYFNDCLKNKIELVCWGNLDVNEKRTRFKLGDCDDSDYGDD